MCFLLKYCVRIYTTIAPVSLFLLFVANIPKERRREILPVAEDPGSRVLSAEEQRRLAEQEENMLRELRLFLRDVTKRLATDKRFNIFSKPVDIEEVWKHLTSRNPEMCWELTLLLYTFQVSDYLEVIRQPMDLSTVMTKIDAHQYITAKDFLVDIDLICNNALEYNPDKDPGGEEENKFTLMLLI